MTLRINLSPQIAAAVPIVSTNIRFRGRDKPLHSATGAARTTPKINLRRMVTAPTLQHFTADAHNEAVVLATGEEVEERRNVSTNEVNGLNSAHHQRQPA